MDAKTLDYEFLRPLVSAWTAKIERAKEGRSRWKETADECLMFYSNSAQAMWDPEYSKKFWKNVKLPRFRITINKSFELVAIFAPNLMWESPHRAVNSKKALFLPPEFFGQDEQGMMAYQQFQQAQQSEQSRDKVIAQLMSGWLNYTPREMPGGGLEGHSERCTIDALIKGRGCLTTRNYTMPGSGRVLTGSFYTDPFNVFTDPDFNQLDECRWMAIKHTQPHYEVEEKFKLKKDSLKNKSTLESSWSHSEWSTDSESDSRRKAGQTGDNIVWYEIFSKAGCGARQTAMDEKIKDHMENVIGRHAYLAICPDVQWPLNMPSEEMRKGATDDDVRNAFSWPVPFWADDRWPTECYDEQTEVLTKDGWKFFKDLSGDELLATVDLETDTLEYQAPSRIIRKHRAGDMVRFSGQQKLDLLVTPKHRMVAYAAHGNDPVIKEAASLLKSDQLKVSVSNWKGKCPVLPEFLSGVAPEDFAEWLGFYIAEGCCSNRRVGKGKSLSWQVVISQHKQNGRDYYENLAKKLPFRTQPYRHQCGSYIISSKALWQYLQPIGDCYAKFVPQWVKDSPQVVIEAFLRGYIAGDGHHCKLNDQTTSATASKRLADDLQELWMKVGKSATISIRKPAPYSITDPGCEERTGMSGQLYVVGVRKRSRASLKNPEKKTVLYSIESGYDGMVYCATVPNGTLVVRRNGKPIICGNCLDFYHDPQSSWPIAPLAPGLGELKLLNFLVSWLANRVWTSSRDFWAVAAPHIEHYKDYLLNGEDQQIIPTPFGVDDVSKAISVLQQPETRQDMTKLISFVSDMFDKRVGLTQFVYGLNQDGTQNRTAEETVAKSRAVSARPEFMQKQVVKWQGRVAQSEAFVTRWFVTGKDVAPLFGDFGAQLWDQLIVNTDVELVTRQFEYTIEASSIRRPNRERDIANFQQMAGIFLPVVQGYGQSSGNYEPFNALMRKWGEYHDADIEGAEIPPPPEPDPAQAEMQQRMQQAEVAKVEAEAQKLMAEAGASAADGQMKQMQMQADMQIEAQKAQMEMEAKAMLAQQDMQTKAMMADQDMQVGQAKTLSEIVQDQARHEQDMRQAEEMHRAKLKQAQQMPKAKPAK